MNEQILKGRTVTLKYGIDPNSDKLAFMFCGLDELPTNDSNIPPLFSQILSVSDELKSFQKPATIEYLKKEVFTLETCISAYLIDYIYSDNDLSHINENTLELIFNNEFIKSEFEKVDDQIVFARDRDIFFDKENTALSLIHEAFRANDASFENSTESVIENDVLADGDVKEEYIATEKKEVLSESEINEEIESEEDTNSNLKIRKIQTVSLDAPLENEEAEDASETNIEDAKQSPEHSVRSIRGIVIDDEDSSEQPILE